jgi:hypothetical protein
VYVAVPPLLRRMVGVPPATLTASLKFSVSVTVLPGPRTPLTGEVLTEVIVGMARAEEVSVPLTVPVAPKTTPKVTESETEIGCPAGSSGTNSTPFTPGGKATQFAGKICWNPDQDEPVSYRKSYNCTPGKIGNSMELMAGESCDSVKTKSEFPAGSKKYSSRAFTADTIAPGAFATTLPNDSSAPFGIAEISPFTNAST